MLRLKIVMASIYKLLAANVNPEVDLDFGQCCKGSGSVFSRAECVRGFTLVRNSGFPLIAYQALAYRLLHVDKLE